MRVTQHSGRTHRNGKTYSTKHNDRNFETKALNIDSVKTVDNDEWYWCQDKFPNLSFDESEQKFYEKFYQKQLDETNAKYEKARHKERIKTMETWRKQKKHAPEEVILQIGRMEERPDIEIFKKCFFQYLDELNKWNNSHGNVMHILNWALHQDELGAPHVHLRRTWDYFNADTHNLELGQEKALELAGIPLPHPEQPMGQHNNRKMTFDAEMRILWQNIAIENGLDIEKNPLQKNEVGMDLDQKIRQKEAKRKQLEIATQKRAEELQTATQNFNKQYEEADLYFKEQQKQFESNQKAIEDFNNSYNEKVAKINEWINASKVIEEENTDIWVDKQFQDCFEKKINTKTLIQKIKEGVKGFIAKVKKSYDRELHGYRKIYDNNKGQTVCEYSYGASDFKEMLLETPLDDIQKAINECRQTNRNTFGEYLKEQNGLSFFERHFKKAKELKREIERKLERTRGHSR